MHENITSCFISAPFGFDLTLFKKIFDEHNITIIDQSFLKLGNSIPEEINKAINHSDLFCAIIPNNEKTSNIFFEIGLAYAKNKQILIFVEKNIELPIELKSFLYFTSNFENESTIRLSIESFLNFGNVKKEQKQKILEINENHQINIVEDQKEIDSKNEAEFELFIEKLFRTAGYLTKFQINYRDSRFDIALWIDKLENFFGNPIIIEVKSGYMSPQALNNCEDQLRQQILKIGGNLGIIIYKGKRRENFPELSKKVPLIIKFSSDELITLLKNDKFESEIIAQRNKIVHGNL